MRDHVIDEYVRLTIEARFREIDRKLETEDLPRQMEEFNLRGVLTSSMAVQAEADLRERAAREKVRTRIDAEKEVHRRKGVPISDDEAREIIEPEIIRLIGEDVGRFFSTGPMSGYVPKYASDLGSRLEREAFDRLHTEAVNAVRLAVVDSGLPAEPVASTGVTIHVNAPNFGVVAGRIDHLNIVAPPGEQLRESLRAILEASRALPDPEAAEVREIVDGLATEAERPKDQNRRLVRTAARRLAAFFRFAADAQAVLRHVDKLPVLFDALSRTLP